VRKISRLAVRAEQIADGLERADQA
jgi:hypothetical protein